MLSVIKNQCIDYNTVLIKVKADRSIKVIDEDTPLTTMIVKRAKGLPRGIQHFNIADNSLESSRYSGELAKEILQEYGLPTCYNSNAEGSPISSHQKISFVLI